MAVPAGGRGDRGQPPGGARRRSWVERLLSWDRQPRLGPGYRGRSPRGGYEPRLRTRRGLRPRATVTLVLRCPEAGTPQRGDVPAAVLPARPAPSSPPGSLARACARCGGCAEAPRRDASSLHKVTPAGVWGCQLLRLNLKTGPCCLCTSLTWGLRPSSPSGQPGLQTCLPLSLLLECVPVSLRLLNLVREGRAVSRLCHGFWSAVGLFRVSKGD